MANFTLVILEYTNEENLIFFEQKYINRFKPEYNINQIAGNSLGYEHTPESIVKRREAALGRTLTEKVRKLMSENRKGENNPFFGKKTYFR
jgi:group I intron endonuclease